MTSTGLFTEDDAKSSLLSFARKDKAKASLIERIYRWETNHFKSVQFKRTGSAGMEVGKWNNLPSNMPFIEMKENGTGIVKKFIVWDSCQSFINYLSDYIDRYSGNYARWYSTSSIAQANYRKNIESVKNKFIV